MVIAKGAAQTAPVKGEYEMAREERLSYQQYKKIEKMVGEKLSDNVKMELGFLGKRIVDFHNSKDNYQEDVETARLFEAVRILAMLKVIASSECNNVARYFIRAAM